ncbi:MAG: hypothetical protein U0169_26585 [Polyangiaceae bacterium]
MWVALSVLVLGGCSSTLVDEFLPPSAPGAPPSSTGSGEMDAGSAYSPSNGSSGSSGSSGSGGTGGAPGTRAEATFDPGYYLAECLPAYAAGDLRQVLKFRLSFEHSSSPSGVRTMVQFDGLRTDAVRGVDLVTRVGAGWVWVDGIQNKTQFTIANVNLTLGPVWPQPSGGTGSAVFDYEGMSLQLFVTSRTTLCGEVDFVARSFGIPGNDAPPDLRGSGDVCMLRRLKSQTADLPAPTESFVCP